MPEMTYATVITLEGQYDQVPCCLFTQPEYSELSLDAKLLYTRMLSLTSYAAYKGWEDKTGIYITMNRTKIMEYLNCAGQKATAVLRELIGAKLVQLDNEENINNGKIYVLKAQGMDTQTKGDTFHRPFRPRFTFWQLPRSLDKSLPSGARLLYAFLSKGKQMIGGVYTKACKILANMFSVDTRTFTKYLTALTDAKLAELKDDVHEEDYRAKESAPSVLTAQEEANLKNPATDYTHDERENQAPEEEIREEILRLAREGSPLRDSVKNALDFDFQAFRLPESQLWLLEEAIDFLTHVKFGAEELIWAGRKFHPGGEVLGILQGFTKEHLRIVMDSFRRQEAKIRNPVAWLHTVMLNVMIENAPMRHQEREKQRRRASWAAGTPCLHFEIGSISQGDETPQERKARFERLIE